MLYAARAGAPGIRFAVFGRLMALRLLLARRRAGMGLLLTPVSIVRYWEFPFVTRHLPARPQRCLDVASPRLLSYYIAWHRSPEAIRILNPDIADATLTASLAAAAGLRSIAVDAIPVAAIAGETARYDAIWSVSVVEHIANDGDIEAMRLMFAALAPGGTLSVTVPVDRLAWDEYRDEDVYQLGLARSSQGYFFQRWYDEDALHSRLIKPLKASSVRLEWFGERVTGRFAAYEQEWLRRGHDVTVDDPREIADWYRSFESWSHMPGQGVCGIAIRKPASVRPEYHST